MPVDIDRFVEDVVIKQAKEFLVDGQNLMPVFFMIGDTLDKEVGVLPVLMDLNEPGAKQKLVREIRKIVDEESFHTVLFVSDAHFKQFESETWEEALVERDKIKGRLSEDPTSREAIIVARVTARSSSSTMIEYKRTDDGIEFNEPMANDKTHSTWITNIWRDVN